MSKKIQQIRKFSASYRFPDSDAVRTTPLTEEEEADEIIKRLSTPPKKLNNDAESIIADMLSNMIVEEIDSEIIASITNETNTNYGSQKNKRT